MTTSMDIDGMALDQPATLRELPQVQEPSITHTGLPSSNGMRCSARCCPSCLHHSSDRPQCTGAQHREPFREIPVKVHIRRPERDSWVYVGRATVSLDTTGRSSQVGEPLLTSLTNSWIIILISFVVVRSTSTASTDKVLTVFSEVSCDPSLRVIPACSRITEQRIASRKTRQLCRCWMH
jgi:hypothetical protein